MKYLDRKHIPLIAAVLCSIISRLFINIEMVSSFFMLMSYPFLLYASRKATEKKQFVLVYVAASAACFARNITYYDATWFGILVIFILSFVFTVIRMVAFFIDHWFMTKKSSFLMTLVYPVIASLIEFVFECIGFGNIINPTVCLHSFPLILQSAAFLGEYGLMFQLFWFISLVVYGVQEKKMRTLSLSLCGALFAFIMIFGIIRLGKAPSEPAGYIRIAFMTDRIEDIFAPSPISSEKNVDDFIRNIHRAAADDADFFMVTEEALKLESADVEPVLQRMCAAAGECGIAVLVPVEVDNGKEKGENVVWFIDSSGQILCRYTKNSLVPIIETAGYVKGDGKAGTFTTKFGGRDCNVALAICFDGSNNILMNTIPEDTDILLLPSWEWDTANLDQNRNQRITSVKRGVTYIKVAVDGYAITYDQWGRSFVKLDMRDREYAYEVADVPVF